LPKTLWLLGHIGQAYAWTLGLLPYAHPETVTIGLLDFDTITEANSATQLLVMPGDAPQYKKRIVAAALRLLDIRTRVVERAFDKNFHPVHHANRIAMSRSRP
jgi:molybdopterin/thiamine biosynthesis adenylyltransferase